MAGPDVFDVLVVGSGASGLAAAVSAEVAGRASRARDQGCAPVLHTWRRLKAAFRPPSATTIRLSFTPRNVWASSHETADPRLVEVLTAESAPAPIHWLEQHGVEFTHENGGYRLRPLWRCDTVSASFRSATVRGMRSRNHCAGSSRAGTRETFPKSPLAALEPTSSSGWRARCGEHEVEAGRGRSSQPAAAAFREAEERGELSTNHEGATGEVTQIALGLGAEARDLDALQYHPNGGAWPVAHAGLLDSGDDAGLRRRSPELPTARSSPILAPAATSALEGDLRRGGRQVRRRVPPRAARGLPRHDPYLRARPTPTSRFHTCCAVIVPVASTRSAEPILT